MTSDRCWTCSWRRFRRATEGLNHRAIESLTHGRGGEVCCEDWLPDGWLLSVWSWDQRVQSSCEAPWAWSISLRPCACNLGATKSFARTARRKVSVTPSRPAFLY